MGNLAGTLVAGFLLWVAVVVDALFGDTDGRHDDHRREVDGK